jgi:hypothetical protein
MEYKLHTGRPHGVKIPFLASKAGKIARGRKYRCGRRRRGSNQYRATMMMATTINVARRSKTAQTNSKAVMRR